MKSAYFSARAAQDLRDIAAYIRRDNPNAAKSFTQAMRKRCEKIAALPLAARKITGIRHELRIVPFRSYIIIYRFQDERVTVERIWHGSRDAPWLLAENFSES